ncbi:Putative DNA-binding protein [Alloactinosynnema sp. L-07]|uniref:helix-turn-helix domain-containing protein n=1 Tax=Alloactinosynnema sp. L-07 TaxID=1653480 RepID=UPI00065F087E|nr:helix-turn-helix transcriptional regulator [Alloactinosynnema sp. L-07]CRK61697.1 Putative DNA-binding protein [Alloactinosynnema sp. L-07]
MELLAHRRKSGKTLEDVAGALGVSTSTVSRLENGKREPTSEEVAAILAILGVHGGERDRLIDLARGGLGSSGMVEYSNPTSQSRTYLGFETRATVITNFEPLLVPGLAQTAEYARAVISAIQVDEDDADIEARVARRMARQAIITRKKAPRFNMILTELGLRQPIGGPKVMARQVRSLVDLADRDNVSLRLIPMTLPAHPGMAGPFALLEFSGHSDVVFLEARTTGLFRDADDEVSLYKLSLEKLAAVALDKAGSVKLLRSISRDMDGG